MAVQTFSLPWDSAFPRMDGDTDMVLLDATQASYSQGVGAVE